MALLRIDGSRSGQPAADEEYRRLETGDILFFSSTPFVIEPDDRAFLLGQKQNRAFHKNISYRPREDRLKGVDQTDPEARARTKAILRDFSNNATAFLSAFLPQYAGTWHRDFASYRPIEEAGRSATTRSRNDLIHVDNFPSRPSHGDRILRIFVNLNPEKSRIWVTSDNFEALARQYARQAGLPDRPGTWNRLRSAAIGLLSKTGLPLVNRPGYDQFMLRFHHFLKESDAFQRECRKDRWEFPPDSAWICFTDTTSHACESGQYALEQTFLVSGESLVWPEKAPLAILEEMVGFPLNDRRRSA